jgi:DNA polymerase III sliding clamp (beta) subunit (PCNA family)
MENAIFVNGLQQVANIARHRAIIPILSNALLECTDGGLKITATNFDISIHCKVRA